MVAAARKHKKAVQMGSQRRSSASIQEGIQKVKEGAIGDVYLARAFYESARGSIGTGKPAAVPGELIGSGEAITEGLEIRGQPDSL